MKQKRKIMSLLLAICLVAGLTPTVSFAEDGNKTIMLGTNGIKDPTVEENKYYTPNSYIYFGVNGSNPMKWRVLDADETNNSLDGIFLLSEYLLASDVSFQQNYHKVDGIYYKGSAHEGEHSNCQFANVWQGSDAQMWCKGFSSNSSNFSSTEQNAMLGVVKEDSIESNLYSLTWGESSLTKEDKMFFLSTRELVDYVGNYNEAPGLTATFVSGGTSGW